MSALSDDSPSPSVVPRDTDPDRFVFEIAEPMQVRVTISPSDRSDWGGFAQARIESGVAELPGWKTSSLSSLQHWANLVYRYSESAEHLKQARALLYQSRAAVEVTAACQRKRSAQCDRAFVYLGYGFAHHEENRGPLRGETPWKFRLLQRANANPAGAIAWSYQWACKLLSISLSQDHPYLRECEREKEAFQLAQQSPYGQAE